MVIIMVIMVSIMVIRDYGPLTHPSIAATRLFGLAQGILLQNLKGFDELKKMS